MNIESFFFVSNKSFAGHIFSSFIEVTAEIAVATTTMVLTSWMNDSPLGGTPYTYTHVHTHNNSGGICGVSEA